MKNVVIFASGRGSNAQKIINHFKNSSEVRISHIVASKLSVGVLDLARANGIPSTVLNKEVFTKTNRIAEFLLEIKTDLIVLAGFLWKIPPQLINAFPNKIINIHPALLPKYGGKGMYGHHIHKAVKEAGESTTGITIHYVNEIYDDGEIIFQHAIAISPEMTAEEIGAAVLKSEHTHLPLVVQKILLD